MTGILVRGGNHFIVDGPLPSLARARSLMREWEMPQIGRAAETGQWRIVTKAFREHLEWAVVLAGDCDRQPAVAQLLAELAARGVEIHRDEPGAAWGGTG